MTRFSTLHPDGSENNVREIAQSAIRACRFFILVPEHYREDGSCKCDDREHRAFMIREWEYSESDFEGIPLRGENVTSKTWPRERPKGTRMGRGHYKLIAEIFANEQPGERKSATWREWRQIVERFADELPATNPSFRRETFLAACGVDE